MRSSATCSAPSRGPWTDLLWGDLGMVLGGVLCTGALFAALLCVMLRLDRLEKKLDALISSKEGADRPNE